MRVVSKKLFCVFWGCLLVLSLLFLPLKSAKAAALNFGGKIWNTIPCVNGLLLIVGPPIGGSLMWTPGISITFLWYQIRIGVQTLGLYAPGGVCACPYGCCECGAIPVQGTIIKIGTSL